LFSLILIRQYLDYH